ncbi:MAG: efflux RND transporter periplasmic adaptor subunit [Phycisphaerae bacterium]
MTFRLRIFRVLRLLRPLAVGIAFLAVVVLLMIWLAGGFERKIQGGPRPAPPPYTGPTATVQKRLQPRTEEAVGSVRPVRETVLTPRIAARVVELKLTAGQHVEQDEVLVRLDDRDMRARVDQLKAALTSATATRDQARIDRARYAESYSRGAATKLEFDRADLAARNADSDVIRASEAVKEAQALLEYTTIRAPTSGIVVDKRVNVGDTVMPGQVLATLYDPTHMQLVASVREMLTQRLKVGQSIGVRMDALRLTCAGTVSEIVPEAESASRTFQVKVTGPCPPGIYAGMFGRIVIPLDSEEILVVPSEAISRVGQLELVDVVQDNRLERRIVRLGRPTGDQVEVLSGLQDGEKVALRAAVSNAATNGACTTEPAR